MERVLAQREWITVKAKPVAEQWDEFLRYWILKEAVSKALHAGLALPFRDMSLSLAPLQLLELPRGYGPSRGWHLEEHRLGASHRIAVAVSHGVAGLVRVIWQPTLVEDVIRSIVTSNRLS
jgi:phosphopantetheinyl transferase